MPDATLTKTRLVDGIWQGLLSGPDAPPEVVATHLQTPLEGVEVTPAEGGHLVRVPIPAEIIADGLQTVLLSDGASGARLGSFSILAGDALAEDIRAEIDLLRAELDMLKRAFRRHCTETA
ncbi:hypothetical protein [Roseisalinus antarcticus]|uniref:Uncharacterized protein n=1 Tax=Roseisalinus antarcticus TaxID=254357 RepID=A0A1Y5TDX6_9RHOB|nr:hypothetical protein [Roseisalinus antarcticus]SLN58157.1 hypothetical protein ROA7023_02650 [Roseisalinus antarcticus]